MGFLGKIRGIWLLLMMEVVFSPHSFLYSNRLLNECVHDWGGVLYRQVR